MPIYEYICAECGHRFEKLATLAKAHVTQECPKCGAPAGERIISLTGATPSGGSGGGKGYCSPGGFG